MHSYEQVVKECAELKRNGTRIETIGLSKHGNKILSITVGNGDKTVLVVCRQHGNEPTSTEAMLQYVKEFRTHNLSNKIRLHVIPVANPDGARTYEHLCRHGKTNLLTSYAARSNRTYVGDINRDHKKRKTAEAQAIFNAIRRTHPKLIIDLHNFFPAYRYFTLQKTRHNFCPAVSLHRKIKFEIRRVCIALCKVSIAAVGEVGGSPAKINGLWPGVDGRLTTVNENILETYYPLYEGIPALTFEALGGFDLCSKGLSMGTMLHKVAVNRVLTAFASM